MKLFVPPYNIEVTRKKIRSVRLRITSDGALKLSIPTHVPLDEAERFVRSHLSWIEKKLEEQQSTPICDDENEPMIFGRPFLTEILPCAREYAIFSDGIMTIHTNTPKDKAKIKALAEQCILHLVQERAEHYLRHYATLLGVEVPPFHFRKMKSRWGSYSLKTKRISLNLRLSRLDERCLAYVTAHELCHILHPNHSAAFHALFDKIMPKNREIERLFR